MIGEHSDPPTQGKQASPEIMAIQDHINHLNAAMESLTKVISASPEIKQQIDAVEKTRQQYIENLAKCTPTDPRVEAKKAQLELIRAEEEYQFICLMGTSLPSIAFWRKSRQDFSNCCLRCAFASSRSSFVMNTPAEVCSAAMPIGCRQE